MNLREYIIEMGTVEFARKYGVPVRTAEAYRQRRRTPRPKLACAIVAASKVTWEGIYSPKGEDNKRKPRAKARASVGTLRTFKPRLKMRNGSRASA